MICKDCVYAEYDADGCYCKKEGLPVTNKDALRNMDFLPLLCSIEEKYNICPVMLFDARDPVQFCAPRCAKFGTCKKCIESWLTEEKQNGKAD